MSRPGSGQRPLSAASDASLDVELPALFPAIFGLQREKSSVGDPWAVDNPAIRQLSSAAQRRNRPQLPSAHSRRHLVEGVAGVSRQTGVNAPPGRLDSLSRNSKSRQEMHVHLPDFPVLPSIHSNSSSPEPYVDIQTEDYDRSDSDLVSLPLIGQTGSVVSLPLTGQSDMHTSLGYSESLVLPRDNSFGSTYSLNSRCSTNHSSPEPIFSRSEQSVSLTSSGPMVRVVSPQNGQLDSYNQDDRSTSPLSPQPPGRPRSRASARRRQDQERLVRQREEEVRQVLQGCYHGDQPAAPSRQVRLYLSSTATDMVNERKELQQTAFPKLRQFCSDLDLDLVIIDLHSSEDDLDLHVHKVYLQEITKCQRRSVGPSFAVLLGNHPGERSPPEVISEEDFKVLRAVVEMDSPEDAQLLSDCYRGDENSEPTDYWLQKHVEPPTDDKGDQWQQRQKQLLTIITSAAQRAHSQGMLPDERYGQFNTSVLESEVTNGILLNKFARRRSLAYLRDLEGLMDDLDNPEAANFVSLQVRGQRVVPNNDSLNTIRDLKETTIPEYMDESNIHSYSPWWQVHGLEPEHCQRNANYLKLLSRHFVADVKRITNFGFKNRNNAWKSLKEHTLKLYREVVQHVQYAQDLLSDYVNWDKSFSQLSEVVKVKSPLVITGDCGFGKSSMIAKLSKEVKVVVGQDCICVTRFLQILTTRPSLHSLLSGICLQICTAYQLDIPADLNNKTTLSLALFFHDLIHNVSELISKADVKDPLVLLIDSIDMVADSETDASSLWWLPRPCPAHVHLVVSMATPENSTQKGLDTFQLKKLSLDEALDFTQALCTKGRPSMCEDQKKHLEKVIKESSKLSILDLSLVTKTTFTWRSFDKVNDLNLTSVIGELLDQTIASAEREFGVNLVTQVCGYIATAHGGISETELVDLLVCDDKLVANHSLTPNVQPLVLIRLRKCLSLYLTEMVRDGQTFMSWSHQPFAERVRSRLPTNLCISLHTSMANMYMDQIHSYINNQTELKTKRSDAKQLDLKPERLLRPFDVVPYHIVNSDISMDTVKDRLYCSLEVLVLRLYVSSVPALTGDLQQLRGDKDLAELLPVLASGQDLLSQLPPDTPDLIRPTLADLILGHLSTESSQSPFISNLVQQCRSACEASSYLHLSPVFPYASHEIHRCHLEASSLTIQPVSTAVFVVTHGPHSATSILDLRTLVPIRQDCILSVEAGESVEPPRMAVSHDGQHLVVFEQGRVTLQQLHSGTVIKQLNLLDNGTKLSVNHFVTNSDCSVIIIVTIDNKLIRLDPQTGQLFGLFPFSEDLEPLLQRDQDIKPEVGAEPGDQTPQMERTVSVVSTSKVDLITDTLSIESQGAIRDSQFSPDFKYLVAIVHGSDCNIILWDTQSWEVSFTLSPSTDACTNSVFSPDSSMLVVGVFPSNHILISIKEQAIKQTLQGDATQSMQHTCLPCFSKTGRLVIVHTNNTQATVFSTETGDKKQMFNIANPCTTLLFSSDESFAFLGDCCGAVSVWDVLVGSLAWTTNCSGLIETLFFDTHQGESQLYTVTAEGCLDSWCLTEVLKGARCKRLCVCTSEAARVQELRQACAEFDRADGYMLDLDMIGAPSSETAACGSDGKCQSSKPEGSASDLQSGAFHDAQLSSDGRFLVTASRKQGVQIWDTSTGSHVRTIDCPDVYKVLLANGGLTLVCATYSKHLMLYSLERGRWQMVDRLRSFSHLPYDDFCVSADTCTLVVTHKAEHSSGKVNIYIIDLVTCHVMAHLLMMVDACLSQTSVMSIKMSRDNAHLLTCLSPAAPTNPCCLVVCDLYKEISMELPSWARNSPSPLPTSRSRAVTPLGIHIEDFGQSMSEQQLTHSLPRLNSFPSDPMGSSLKVSDSSLGQLMVPDQPSDRLDHLYPTQTQQVIPNKSQSVEGADGELYEGIVINVIEDESGPGELQGAVGPPESGLLGAGLLTAVKEVRSDAEAMMKLNDSTQTGQTDENELKQETRVTSGALPEADSESKETAEGKEKNEDLQSETKSEESEEAQDVSELREALTKCLQNTPSTDSESGEGTAGPITPRAGDTPTGLRTVSPTGDRPKLEKHMSGLMVRRQTEVVLGIIEESDEEEEGEAENRQEGERSGKENVNEEEVGNEVGEQKVEEGQDIREDGDKREKDCEEVEQNRQKAEVKDNSNQEKNLDQIDVQTEDKVEGQENKRDIDENAHEKQTDSRTENEQEDDSSEKEKEEIGKEGDGEKETIDSDTVKEIAKVDVHKEENDDQQEKKHLHLEESDQLMEDTNQEIDKGTEHVEEKPSADSLEPIETQKEQEQSSEGAETLRKPLTRTAEDSSQADNTQEVNSDTLQMEPAQDTTDEEVFLKTMVSEGGCPDLDLSASHGRFRGIDLSASMSATAITNPAHSISQMSPVLPFDFGKHPPDNWDNPTGRRRELGALTRVSHVSVENPPLTTVIMGDAELLMGTQRGHLLVMDLSTCTVTKCLCAEPLNAKEMERVIEVEQGDVSKGQDLPEAPHQGPVTHVSRSHDSRYVVVASRDRTLSLWNMSDLGFMGRLEGHTAEVTWGEMSGDTSMVVSGSVDRTIRLWDRQSHSALYVVNTLSPVIQARFSFGDVHVVARLGAPGLSKMAVFKVHRAA